MAVQGDGQSRSSETVAQELIKRSCARKDTGRLTGCLTRVLRHYGDVGQPEGMQIGCKFLLKNGTCVRRGLIMLTPKDVVMMGGRVEAWDRKWRDGRKARLRQELEREAADQG